MDPEIERLLGPGNRNTEERIAELEAALERIVEARRAIPFGEPEWYRLDRLSRIIEKEHIAAIWEAHPVKGQGVVAIPVKDRARAAQPELSRGGPYPPEMERHQPTTESRERRTVEMPVVRVQPMPLIKKKSNVETGTLGKTRISKELYTRLERYCAFTGRRWEERHEVIEVLLRYALDHDADFKKEADADPNLAVELPKPARQTKEKVAAATQTP